MKHYAHILQSIDTQFELALSELRSDPIFASEKNIYTLDDKARIAHLWIGILGPFRHLQRIIRSLAFRSFFTFGSKNSFVARYAAVITYYNMVYALQKVFGMHEEFLRQYLDDTFRENYSTLARYIYRTRFYSVLLYPREYFLALKDRVDPSLIPLFSRDPKVSHDILRRGSLDSINIWYYIRYRISLIFSWISQHGGRIMMHIHLTRRERGYIDPNLVDQLLPYMEAGDILLTRHNWAATNLNIPGFWKHMSMYLGTGKDLREQYTLTGRERFSDEIHYCIEAIGLGVRIIPLETLTEQNDYLGVIRPRFSREKKIRAIERTLGLIGRAYDYAFNFYSDTNYVCSTLVMKAYLQESEQDEGIHITLTRIGTGITYPPHDIVKKMCQEHSTVSAELDFVGFIDARERTGESFLSDISTFLATTSRPRLSFFLP